MKHLVAAFCLLLAGAHAAGASPILIDFNSETSGAKGNGFVTDDSALVSFSDTIGANLQVLSLFESNNSPALVVFSDDASRLQMNFTTAFTSIGLDFGNDDPSRPVTTTAWLAVFSGATLVGQVSVLVNHDDLMNQSINFAGAAFDNALFWYGDPAGTPIDLIEVVDNIRLDSAAAVPEPASMLLLGTGLAAVARRRFRRR